MNIDIVSSKWKYIGVKIIIEPFKKNKKWFRYEFSIIKNWVSSLPKWWEATIKKITKEIDGAITHKKIIIKEIKIYDK